MKRLARLIVLSAGLLLTCTSCDIMLYALAYTLDSAANVPSYSTYTTPAYGGSSYGGSSYTSSSSNSSSSARQSDMYLIHTADMNLRRRVVTTLIKGRRVRHIRPLSDLQVSVASSIVRREK